MFVTVAVAASLFTPAADPPASKELFGKEASYKDQSGKEQTFVGVLQLTPEAKGEAGSGRKNTYRLEMGDKKYREIYTSGSDAVLKQYVGYTVKFTGKAVESEAGGAKVAELWPSFIELVPAPPKADPKKDQ